jgi:2-isopropylmalate synthase
MTDIASDRQIRIFDTTLRDGEQAPGCSMTLREKLRVAKALSELNVDLIEAGFPAASPGDFESVKAIADANLGPIICGLARCNASDIEKVHAAVKGADRHRIHVFVATSKIHRDHKLKMAKEEIIKSAVGAITMARELCDDVEFSPEDASRTELSYLAEVVTAAVEAGATTVNIPDTVGYTVPAEFDNLFRYLMSHVPGIDDITLSVHCHNDLGMAVANSLAAVQAGARQIECTINGIGERAGNCSLQHGMLQHSLTYEIMRPEDVGLSSSSLVLGKHSGRHAFRDRVQELGFELDEFETNRAFQEFKKLADKKKDLYDGDIEAIIMNVDNASVGPWALQSLEVRTSTDKPAKATVILIDENAEVASASAGGDGPIAAAFQALEQVTGVVLTLKNFELHSASRGEDALGEVTVTVEHDGSSFRGNGTSVDIVEAGSRACLEVMNRILRRKDRGGDTNSAADAERATI